MKVPHLEINVISAFSTWFESVLKSEKSWQSKFERVTKSNWEKINKNENFFDSKKIKINVRSSMCVEKSIDKRVIENWNGYLQWNCQRECEGKVNWTTITNREERKGGFANGYGDLLCIISLPSQHKRPNGLPIVITTLEFLSLSKMLFEQDWTFCFTKEKTFFCCGKYEFKLLTDQNSYISWSIW